MTQQSDELTDGELYDAEWKLQNCIRITLDVESYYTEVNTGKRWVKVSDYVTALITQQTQEASIQELESIWKKVVKNDVAEPVKWSIEDRIAQLKANTNKEGQDDE